MYLRLKGGREMQRENNSPTHAIYEFIPESMDYVKTQHEGTEKELLELAGELLEGSVEAGKPKIYIVRPLENKP